MFRKLLGVLALASSWALAFTPAHAEWWEAETAHFVVKSRASEDDAREYALELARFDAVLRTLQGMEYGEFDGSRANKPTVYRFGRISDIAKAAGLRRGGIAGFFIPRAGASVGFAPALKERVDVKRAIDRAESSRMDPRSVLFHEYTHYFMLQHFPGAYPRWYVEGFAELMATVRFNDDGSYHVGDPPQYRADQVRYMRDFELVRMLDDDYKLRGTDSLQHYAKGWLLTHYLNFDSEGYGQLRNYLKALSAGEDSLTAARREFGDLNALEKKLDKYKKGPFPGIQVANVPAAEEVRVRKLTAAEEAAIDSEIELAVGVGDPERAREIASELTNVIERYGDSPHVLALLGQAQLIAKDYGAAEATGERIVTLDDEDSIGWLIRAFAAMELIDTDAAFAETARSHATKAAARDREDPRPLILYFATYREAGEPAPEIAVAALEQAYPYAGTDVGYRLLFARQLLVEERLDHARIMLMPIAYRGHRTSEPKDESDPSLARVLKLVKDGDRDGALAMIDKMIGDEDADEGEDESGALRQR